MPRPAAPAWLIMLTALLTLGCAGRSPVAPDSGALPAASVELPTPAYGLASDGQGIPAAFDVTIDPATLEATVAPVPGTRSLATQAITYEVNLEAFLTPGSFRITGISKDAEGDVVVGFRHQHPFAAPDLSLAPSKSNRADLGYTGRLLIVSDRPTTEFFDGEVSLDPTLIKDADGYAQPGILLGATVDKAYPYMLLVDEAKDNREGITNYGLMTGNYLPSLGGWQRHNIGSDRTWWTGYDFLHQGQACTNTFTIRREALADAPLTLRVMLWVKYADPRGTPSHYLPPTTTDPLAFAYRLPFAALDTSTVRSESAPLFVREGPATQLLECWVRDHDADAAVASGPSLSTEADVSLVPLGTSGLPSLSADAPLLSAVSFPLAYAAEYPRSPIGEYLFTVPIYDHLQSLPDGEVAPLVIRAVDPEDTAGSEWRRLLRPDTGIITTLHLPRIRTYQVILAHRAPIEPPVVSEVTPSGYLGPPGTRVTFEATVANVTPLSTYEWELGGDPIEVLDMGTSIRARFPLAGDFSGRFRVTTGLRTTEWFEFSYRLSNEPSIVTVYPASTSPQLPGTRVSFSARGARINGPDVAWEWEFGAAAAPNASTEAIPEVTIRDPGTHTGRVRVQNSTGWSEWVEFPLEIADPVPFAWHHHVVRWIPESLSPASRQPSILVHGGHIYVFYGGPTELRRSFTQPQPPPRPTLQVAIANEALPTTDLSWQISTIDSAALSSYTSLPLTSATLIDGRPAVAYSTPAGIWYARALVPIPVSDPDWSLHFVSPGYSQSLELREAAGQPAVLVRGHVQSAPYDIEFGLLRATASVPSGPIDWIRTLIGSGPNNPPSYGPGEGADFLVLNDHFAVSYLDHNAAAIRFAASTDLAPTGPQDWSTHDLYTGPGIGNATSLARFGSALGVAYVRDSQTYIGYSATLTPTVPVHWNFAAMSAPTVQSARPRLLRVGGLPAVITQGPEDELLVYWGLGPLAPTQPEWRAEDTGVRGGPPIYVDWSATAGPLKIVGQVSGPDGPSDATGNRFVLAQRSP